jgi:PPOX class probable F420-dependent enzyme
MSLVRKGLSIEQLGDLLEEPFNATLATYRRDGSVLLSPVWHEWRDDGFSIITGRGDVKLRHIQRASRAAVCVSENDFPFRGVELSGSPTIETDLQFARDTFTRIANRFLGPQRAATYLSHMGDDIVVIRLTPGQLRTWDFADDAANFGAA